MNFPIETAAAFPSRTVAAFPLSSTVQPSFDPLSVNDPWASAVAVTPVQQQHQTQVPFWPQLQGTEFWPQTGQPQQWSTPRSPIGLTGPPPTTLQGIPANDWQSPLPPPPTWDAKGDAVLGGEKIAPASLWASSARSVGRLRAATLCTCRLPALVNESIFAHFRAWEFHVRCGCGLLGTEIGQLRCQLLRRHVVAGMRRVHSQGRAGLCTRWRKYRANVLLPARWWGVRNTALL